MSFRKAKHANPLQAAGNDDDTSEKISGVKPWINGGYLVSTGIRALDDLVGGGQGLGTILTIESDNISSYSDTVLSYGIAQALSSGHRVLVITDCISSSEEISASLPYNQNVKVDSEDMCLLQQRKHQEAADTDNGASNSNLAESDICGSDAATATETGLKIAWQYEKYISKGRFWRDRCLHSDQL